MSTTKTMNIVKKLRDENFPLDYIIKMLVDEVQRLEKELRVSKSKIRNLKIDLISPPASYQILYDDITNGAEIWNGANRLYEDEDRATVNIGDGANRPNLYG